MYQAHSKAKPMPRNTWPTATAKMTLFVFMCHAFSSVLLFSVLLIFVWLELCLRDIFERHEEHEVDWVRKWGY